MPKYYIGTAGWSYKDWVPSFYPKQQSVKFDWLQFYSHYFNCVEVNSTYYAYLSPKIVEGWVKKVADSDDFIFHLKLHQDFTHKRKFDEQSIKAVRYNLDILANAERLGGLLIQFPYSFPYNNSATQYIQQLKETFPNYKCFVINSFGKEQSYEERSERYKYLYSPGELVEIEQKIKSIQSKVKEVHVIMNNHPQGDAIANAFELIHLLEEKDKVEMPGTIFKAYPRLEELLVN